MEEEKFKYLVASASAEQLGVPHNDKPPIWVFLASLAKGGAERIVLDWLVDASRSGYPVRLVVQHQLPHEWPVPANIPVIRAQQPLPEFFTQIAKHILTETDRVYTHLIRDDVLELFWKAGLAVVPTVHNAKSGWRNAPQLWSHRNVPFAIAVSDKIGAELQAGGCDVPLVVIRHKPNVSPRVFSQEQRELIRKQYRVGPDELLVGMIGSLKAQKNYSRALRVLAELRKHRPAKLLIAGGYQGPGGAALFKELCQEGAALGLHGQVFMPGFVDVEGLMPAFDVVLNTSDFEGFSIATQEALFSGLPVIAADVGGQSEIDHEALTLVTASDIEAYVQALAAISVRRVLESDTRSRALPTAKLWTLAAVAPLKAADSDKVLFVTANLNAGGAQRSLVNLTSALHSHLELEVAVTGTSTHPYFGNMLKSRGVPVFRTCESRNVLDIAAAILQHLAQHPARTVCFWNVDPKLKLLLTKFLPQHRVIDVSPGYYAFLEMQEVAAFQKDLAYTETQFYKALDSLVLKFTSDEVPQAVAEKLVIIPNGVPVPLDLAPTGKRRLVVQGRIAPSKQLDTILSALPLVREKLDCELHIYGQAEPRCQDTLFALLQQAEPLKDVFFYGAKPDLVEQLGQFDGAVVLGTHQGCPNAVLEALAAGVPVVANDSGGTRELVLDGKTGILLPEEVTAEMVAQAIVQMLAMDRTELKARALSHAENFSMDRMFTGYLNLFKERLHAQAAA